MDRYFDLLLKLLSKRRFVNEVPVSALIVKDNKIIAKAVNRKFHTNKCVCHAEILCIIKAEKKLHDWRLDDCELYVTLEPCDMCKEVIKQARIKSVHYLLKSNFNKVNTKVVNYDCCDSPYSDEYKKMFQYFFKNKR